jgi:hypothetical protein
MTALWAAAISAADMMIGTDRWIIKQPKHSMRASCAGPEKGWAVRLAKWLRLKNIWVGWTVSGSFSRVFYGQLNDPWDIFKLYRFTKSFRTARKINNLNR